MQYGRTYTYKHLFAGPFAERSSGSHEQNIICSQTNLDDIAHEQTISCMQLIAGHVIGSWPMKRKKNLDQTITNIMLHSAVSAEV